MQQREGDIRTEQRRLKEQQRAVDTNQRVAQQRLDELREEQQKLAETQEKLYHKQLELADAIRRANERKEKNKGGFLQVLGGIAAVAAVAFIGYLGLPYLTGAASTSSAGGTVAKIGIVISF